MSSPLVTPAAPQGERSTVPKKLRDDAIIEALCSLQYEATELPEVIIGRLSDESKWTGYTASRLPLANLPFPIRNADPNLRAQPTIALKSADGAKVVQVGERVISYHNIGANKYCGWEQFRTELISVFETLFEKLNKPEIKKISFRYVNAIVANRHSINGVHELNLDVRIDGMKLDGPINLNYTTSTPSHVVTSRVAHTSFVQVQGGSLPTGTSAVVDIEVTTPGTFSATDLRKAIDWIEAAHSLEKEAFFRLIPRAILKTLREE